MIQFDIRDDGAVLHAFFKDPTEKEVQQFSSGSPFEIRMVELYGVIMLTMKIGNLNWMDAPYTPHLSRNLSTITFPSAGQGLGLTIYLINAVNGEIKNIRLVGLSEKFSKKILGLTMEQKMQEFDENKYHQTIDKIYAAYTTKQIVSMSKDYCKIGG